MNELEYITCEFCEEELYEGWLDETTNKAYCKMKCIKHDIQKSYDTVLGLIQDDVINYGTLYYNSQNQRVEIERAINVE